MLLKKIIVAVSVLLMSTCSHAEKVNLESFAKNLDSIAIGVLPFTSSDNKTQTVLEPEAIIAEDLGFSGRFSVSSIDKSDASQFKQKNIPLYIGGSYHVDGQSVTLSCYVRATDGDQKLMERKYEGSFETFRTMAHRFSNEVLHVIFSEQGDCESKILFVKDNGAVKNVMVMDYDGYNQRQLTFNNTLTIYPASADATSFMCTTFIRGHSDIARGSLTGGGLHILTAACTRASETSPAVSPIDGKIVFASSRTGNMDIFVCNADGSNVKQLTFNSSIETAPCWSPNGSQIAFTSDRGGSPQIYVMDANGGNAHRITFEGGYQDSPAWSPKGDRIAYMSQSNGEFNIWTINSDGSNPIQLTTNPGSNEYPSWSPNGRHIVFSNKKGKASNLYAIMADGTHLRKLTNNGNVKMPDWSPY